MKLAYRVEVVDIVIGIRNGAWIDARTTRRRIWTPWLVILLSAIQLACTTVSETQEAPALMATDGQANIVAALLDDGRFTEFLMAVEQAGMLEPLSHDGPFTVFVPLQSIDGLPINAADQIAAGTVMADDLRHIDGQLIMLSGQAVPISGIDGLVLAEGISVIQADVPAANGVIHLIERPFPET